MNHPITIQTTPRIHMGGGAVSKVVAEVERLGGKTVMIITDAGLVQTGYPDRIESMLKDAGCKVVRFDDVDPDPGYEIAVQAARAAKTDQVDLMIGLGGGSPIDIAKVAAVLMTNPDPVEAYFGIDLVPRPGLDTIMIPTTAGTGSEVTPIAILSDDNEKLKKGIVSPHLFPRVAILDAELTVGLPPHVTAATGMDALIHAVEAYTSKNANSMTDVFARQAMTLIFANLRTAYADGSNLDARAAMLEGSLLAGMAFANAGVTAVHAFAYPIGAEFHIPHGVANSIMLEPVMEFNMLGNLPRFARMAEIIGESVHRTTQREAAAKVVKAIGELVADLNIPRRLSSFGIEDQHIPDLAEGVMKVTRLLANNPRQLTRQDAEMIYRRVL